MRRDAGRGCVDQQSHIARTPGKRKTATAARLRSQRRSSGRTTMPDRQPAAHSRSRRSSGLRRPPCARPRPRLASAAALAAARSRSCARRLGPISCNYANSQAQATAPDTGEVGSPGPSFHNRALPARPSFRAYRANKARPTDLVPSNAHRSHPHHVTHLLSHSC
jgi:hypothetical protein